MDPARAAALHALLGLPGPPPETGDPLPPFFHQIYFWTAVAPDQLGPDGHPRTGDLVPDLGLPRRMWAGGRLQIHAPLRAGIAAEKTTVCAGFTRKTGRSGELGLVTLRHVIRQRGAPAVTEEQDLIYRAAAGPGDPSPVPPMAPEDTAGAEDVTFDTALLFRYSALTFNGHRIHYDLDYARNVEGYSGLVVHGPLLAQLLMLRARERLGELSSFRFRATAPLFHFETARLCNSGNSFWARGPDGRLCMEAVAS